MLRLTPKPTLTTLPQLKISPAWIQKLRLAHLPFNAFQDVIQKEIHANPLLKKEKKHDILSDDTPIYSQKPSLIDYLDLQLQTLTLTEKEKNIASDLISELNTQGFLPHFKTLSPILAHKHTTSQTHIKDVLNLLQTLEPEGIFAQSLSECLLIQLNHLDLEDKQLYQLIKTILQHHFEELAFSEESLARKLNLSLLQTKKCKLFIKNHFNPNPAAEFDISSGNLLLPSYEIIINNTEITLKNLEENQLPKIYLDQKRIEMLSKSTNTEEKKQLKKWLKKANETLEKIKFRQKNMEKIVTYIIEKQKDYFLKDQKPLIPLPQNKIAKALNLEPSLISRFLNQKSIQTPKGHFLIKTFCPRNHFGYTKENLKSQIQTLQKQHPSHSSTALKGLLAQKNIHISRRTISKYMQI